MPEALSSAIPVIIPALATITSVWATIQGIKKIRREAINRGILAGLKWAPVPSDYFDCLGTVTLNKKSTEASIHRHTTGGPTVNIHQITAR